MQVLGVLFTAAYLSLVFVLSLYGLHRCWILYLYFRHYKWAKPALVPSATAPWPIVTVQLPVYNERYVVERLIDTVCRMDYPKDLLEIQVLDDSTDDTRELVAAKVRTLQAQGIGITHVHRSDRVGYKAGALEAGLNQARGGIHGDIRCGLPAAFRFLVENYPLFSERPDWYGAARVGAI